ncbi:MAG: polyprenyl synthetase family protein [Bacteroidales bacterium]|nr:polyprenyl synthetase family protein [Bacteroidales bacterium]
MPGLDDIRKPVAEEMKDFEKHFRSSMKSNIPLLNIITNYLLRRKGKQIRPLFVFLSAKMLGEVNDSTFHAASLIELLHTATLIHDDVVDESYERRGFFSINALWKSKVAVLLGDYLLAKGLLLAVDNKEFELLSITSEAVREMSEGELLQIQKSRKLNITKEEYFEIIRKKTATLIAACTASGAKSVGCDDETIQRLKVFGENIGMAFQIKDDLFDYQKQGIIGKPTGNDIKEKKFTLPLIHALENCSSSEKTHIIKIIKKHNNNSKKVQEVVDFAVKNNGLKFSVEKMNEYHTTALDLITHFPENESKNALINLANFVVTRSN